MTLNNRVIAALNGLHQRSCVSHGTVKLFVQREKNTNNVVLIEYSTTHRADGILLLLQGPAQTNNIIGID